MSDGEDWFQRPRDPQQGCRQEYPQEPPPQQDQQWRPQQYDPDAHLQRLQSLRQQSWSSPGEPPQPGQTWQRGPGGPSYPPQPQYGQQHGWDQAPQQAYPSQQPPAAPGPRQSKLWPARHKLLSALIAAGAIIIIAVAASASDKPSTPAASTATATGSASPSASPVSAPARPDCATRLKTWVDGGQLTTFGNDVGAFGGVVQTLADDMQETGTAPDGDTAAVQSAAATIESDAQAVEASPAPACLPGLRGNVADAAKDYSTAAIDMTNALNQLSAGNTTVASADVDSASTAEDNGNAKISTAERDVTAYNASQGS